MHFGIRLQILDPVLRRSKLAPACSRAMHSQTGIPFLALNEGRCPSCAIERKAR